MLHNLKAALLRRDLRALRDSGLRLALVILCAATCTPSWGQGAAEKVAGPRVLTLEQCLDLAVQQNHRRPASQFAVALAEA